MTKVNVAALVEKHKGHRTKILGACLLEGMNEKEAREVIREAGLVRERSGFRSDLYAKLAKGPLAKAELAKMIDGASKNTKVHEKHYEAIVDLANAIWASAKAAK